jgi:DNA-binding SARP family transcriptional activator
MAHLDLALFGPFQLTLDHQVIERFESNKVRALLAFLAVEHHRPHPREALAELLWPGHTIEAARGNFRRALANLRAVLHDQTAAPPILHITREALQFNLAAAVSIDVVRFLALAQTPESQPEWAASLEQALALYRGPFLEGFHADDCQEFEQWITAARSELEQLAARALFRLAQHDHINGNVARALLHYRRGLALNPYDEAAQRGLMLALVDDDQRSAALAHYVTYRRELQKELGAQPETQTAELAAAIQQGRLAAATEARLVREARPDATAPLVQGRLAAHPFVAREQELAALHAQARQAALGHGCVALVMGEAGSGKTSLLHEIARQLGRTNPPWLVMRGNCTALLGIGDLYQSFVDGLRLFVQQERSLSNTPPAARNHHVEVPEASNEALRWLWEQAPDWARRALTAAAPAANAQSTIRQAPPASEAALFDQLARFLDHAARSRPLLLALDNLHWADAGTVALLYHLTQALARSRVFIVGAYRPGALALARAERSHPLGTMIQHLRHQTGAAMIDLDQANGRDFVDALLDRQPNRLQPPFRETLYRHTEGHALFTVELLHTLAAAGWLSQDAEGQWENREVLDWDTLPPRVEALIRERIDGLPPADRALLNAACVQGDEFDAHILAAVLGSDAQAVIVRLSGDLAHAHRLVLPGGVLLGAGTQGSVYHFRHHLFQAYLYGALDDVQRTHLHRAVGLELERLFAQRGVMAGVTLQALAWHCERGGEQMKALNYLRTASEQACAWHAYAEAVGYLTKALALAPPAQPALRFDLLAAREQVHSQQRNLRAQAADISELERLAELTHDPRQRLVAALRRATLAEQTTHYAEAIVAANAALALAAAQHDPAAEIEARRVAGRSHWWRGELDLARRSYVHALHWARAAHAPDAVADCLLHLGVACWSLDDLAGAAAAFGEVRDSALGRASPFVRAVALMGLGMAACARGDYSEAEGRLDVALTTARDLHHLWLEGQVLLNQLALYRQSAAYDRCLALYDRLLPTCQAINDRWTAAAGQVEAAEMFVQLGAWARAKRLIAAVTVAVDALAAALLKVRLLLLTARLHLDGGEPEYAAAAAHALPIAARLGVPHLLAEAWLLTSLRRQRQGRWTDAADALRQARASAQGEVAARRLPEIVGAQAQLALERGQTGEALAGVEELLAGSPTPLIDQAPDSGSLYWICYTVLNAAGEPWAEQMLVRGNRWLADQAASIGDAELRRSFCEDIPRHRELRALGANLTSTPGPFSSPLCGEEKGGRSE